MLLNKKEQKSLAHYLSGHLDAVEVHLPTGARHVLQLNLEYANIVAANGFPGTDVMFFFNFTKKMAKNRHFLLKLQLVFPKI
jgi:hypothetical protein